MSHKKIHMPEVKTFSELFTVEPEYDGVYLPGSRMKIGSYMQVSCSDDGPYGLRVRPTDKVLSFINTEMIQIENDEIWFKAVMRDDGTALIIAAHNKIIGSRWLAVIPQSEIPKK